MRKVWLESYPSGTHASIDLDEFESVNDILADACRKYGPTPAFRNFSATITYSQLDSMSRKFAAWLQSAAGLRTGSRVALMMPNLLQYPVALFGALRAGMIVVNVNPLYTARELEHQLKDSGAEVIVILENFAHVLERALPKTAVRRVVVTRIGDLMGSRRPLVNFVVKRVKKMVPPWSIEGVIGFRSAIRAGAKAVLKEVHPTRQDVAFLQYTGGTTGTSKGAMLTHGNMIANVLQAFEWSKGHLQEGREVGVTALPMYHIFALTTNCLLGIRTGGINVLITNPRDMHGFVKELKKTPFSYITGVNTLYNGLLNTQGFAELDFRRLKFAIGGGAAVHRVVAERWQKVTGRPLIEGYGLTEASPLVTCNPLGEPCPGSIGLPFPSTDVAIRDENDVDVPLGAQGEICVRGPQVMQGYWQRPDETRQAFSPTGWLRTGDIGMMDERGYLWVTDRKKDMILVSGFNVYPNEVEGVIAEMPGVTECAVIGVPDDAMGEAVKAYIVANDPEVTPESVIAFCRKNLTNYKVPRQIEFRSELPKSLVGKVLRRDLRVDALAGQGRADAQAAGEQ